MNTSKSKKVITVALGGALMIAITAGTACARNDGGETSQKTSESGVVTNENGSVSRSFSESTVTTNGNMVTEHRRETRTTLDTDGNLLETSTSEYAQSYPVGDVGMRFRQEKLGSETDKSGKAENVEVDADSFLGLKFGETFAATNFVSDLEEPTLVRTKFTPQKPLAGFDDYYVYVTPTTHKVVKVYACAKQAVEPGARWRRHYLIEALEKRYRTWARLCSFWRPCYAFDLGNHRYVTACLAGATDDYETVLCGWDETQVGVAVSETEALREEARKNARKQRESRVDAAAQAF